MNRIRFTTTILVLGLIIGGSAQIPQAHSGPSCTSEIQCVCSPTGPEGTIIRRFKMDSHGTVFSKFGLKGCTARWHGKNESYQEQMQEKATNLCNQAYCEDCINPCLAFPYTYHTW